MQIVSNWSTQHLIEQGRVQKILYSNDATLETHEEEAEIDTEHAYENFLESDGLIQGIFCKRSQACTDILVLATCLRKYNSLPDIFIQLFTSKLYCVAYRYI